MTSVVFVSGVFNVLHAGHLRLLRFARDLGDQLVVGVAADSLAGGTATVSESERTEAVRALHFVDDVVLVRDSFSEVILKLRPAFVVKGREHADKHNPEATAVKTYGGHLVFSSGNTNFREKDLLASDAVPTKPTIELPWAYMTQHGISLERLNEILLQMNQRRCLVVGDVIVDEYISCHPLGMSREDPTLVVTPVESKRFIGGAAIVAGHAAGLAAQSHLLSVVGTDDAASFAQDALYQVKVRASLFSDISRPTTLKQRWRANQKTLLRVSHLLSDPISHELEEMLLRKFREVESDIDLVLFSDFSYGVLTPNVISEVRDAARAKGCLICGDSQSSSQVGDVTRFIGSDLLTPTEFEARISLRNFEDGLVVIADSLLQATDTGLLLITLGEDGLLLRESGGDADPPPADRIPALNSHPVDVSGAGDALFVTAALARASGANQYETALLGSIASALQVSRLGNRPLSLAELLRVLE